MSASHLLVWLSYTTLASSIAIILVLLLRKPLRQLAGPRVAYALWCLVPLVLLAALVPAGKPLAPIAAPIEGMLAFIDSGNAAAVLPQAQSHATGILAVWLIGMALMLCWLIVQQWRFVRRLGRLQPHTDGLWLAETQAGLPALIGIVRPRIVLPADFFVRYDAQEQHLMLLHENAHRRSFDMPGNALCALLRVLFWFNPLLHLAATRFRHDQELACDARVLQKQPDACRTYAGAMLKTHLADEALPLGCHWRGPHPLKERVMQLHQKPPHTSLRFVGMAMSLSLALAASWAAWAMQPNGQAAGNALAVSGQKEFDAHFQLSLDGQPPQPFQTSGRYGERFEVSGGAPHWTGIAGTIVPVRFDGGKLGFRADLAISQQGQLRETPSVVVVAGETGRLSLAGDGGALNLSFFITPNNEAAALEKAQPFAIPGLPPGFKP